QYCLLSRQGVWQAVVVADLGAVRNGVELQDLLPDGADQVGGDDRAGELGPSRAARAAREGIEQAEVRELAQHLAEVAVPHLQGGDGVEGLRAAQAGIALPAPEEEELVLDDGAAQGAAVDAGRGVGL